MPMNISLTPHLEEMIREKIASGAYNSAREVVREAASPPGTRRSVANSEAPETSTRRTGGLEQRRLDRVRSTGNQTHCAGEEVTEEWEVSGSATN